MTKETVICNCLEEHEINGNSSCITCQMDLIILFELQNKKKNIENQLRQLGIDLAIVTSEIHLRTVKPVKTSVLHIKSVNKIKSTIKEKGKLEAMELIGLVLADKKDERNNIIN